ncbi:hypothetical protein BU17DRAFT_70459 [Hysterangium stoloniferum]|nr:hypothetical protein BU17DRAFT_70459 [Hysterangium stoloniferum]
MREKILLVLNDNVRPAYSSMIRLKMIIGRPLSAVRMRYKLKQPGRHVTAPNKLAKAFAKWWEMHKTIQGIGFNESRVDTDDIAHLMIDLKLERCHRSIEVNTVEIMHTQYLRVSLSTIARFRSLGGLPDLATLQLTDVPGPGLLFPKGTRVLQSLLLDYITRNILFTIGPLLIYPVMDVLSHESHEYWRLSQEAVFGVELEEICPKGSERWENTLVKLQKAFSELSTFLDKNGADGPFVLGREVTFADFILVSKLETMAKIIPETWENRIQHWDNSRWQKMRVACAPWIQ